jgi:hypothetical protein
LPAHDRDRYRSTAAAVDAHEHSILQSTIAALPVATAEGQRFVFTATRIGRTTD